jgi:hypothetical protein
MGKNGDELASDGANGDVKYKARGVFAGNNVQTKTGTAAHELYTEVSNCPATMASARAVMAAAAVKGWDVTLRDAEAAYLQSSILGKGRPTCWVRLPRAWWPSTWFGPDGAPLFRDPVVQLARALYGHPESGALWEQHLASILREQGWSPIDAWPGVWRHDETGAVIVVYVDDLLMAGRSADTKRLWATIEKSVGFKDPAEPIGRYLGAYHAFVTTTQTGTTTTTTTPPTTGTTTATTSSSSSCGTTSSPSTSCASGTTSTLSVQMREFLVKAVEIYESEGGMINGATATPYLDSLAVDDDAPEGKMKASAASHLMRLLYAARVARPDLITSVTRLAHHVSKWKMQHDIALRRIFSYIKGTTDLVLTGTLSADDISDFEIHVYPDADLGGDHSSSKSTSGLWIEATSRDGTRS